MWRIGVMTSIPCAASSNELKIMANFEIGFVRLFHSGLFFHFNRTDIFFFFWIARDFMSLINNTGENV